MFHQPEGNGGVLKIELGSGGKPRAAIQVPRARFTVFGEEIIDKKVKPGGNAGRVYLPIDWVGKHVKIIRID